MNLGCEKDVLPSGQSNANNLHYMFLCFKHSCKGFLYTNSFNPQNSTKRQILPLSPTLQMRKLGYGENKSLGPGLIVIRQQMREERFKPRQSDPRTYGINIATVVSSDQFRAGHIMYYLLIDAFSKYLLGTVQNLTHLMMSYSLA